MDIDLPDDLPSTSASTSCSTLTEHVKYVDHETQTIRDESKTLTKLRRKIRTLKQTVKRQNVKISNMKDVINEISKRGHSNESLDAILKNYFEGRFHL